MVKIPDNLADIFVRTDGYGAWAEIHAVKCWSANSNDARISIIVSRLNGETGFRLKFQFDNCGFNESTLVLDGVITPYWYDYTDEGAIRAGEWYKITYFFKRPPAGKSDLTNGRAQCVLTRLSTDEQIVVTDRIGGTSLLPADAIKHVTNSGRFWGYYEHEFTRYIIALCYTGGFPATGTIKWIFSNYEFWTKRPYFLI